MRRLRQRLEHYYATDGQRDSVVIALSRGTYAASIERRASSCDDNPPDGSADETSGGRPRFAAYEVRLRARYLLGQMSVTSIREAASLIEDLLRRDPTFGAAHATLAECYRAFLVLEMMPPEEVIPRMKAACATALALDAKSAEAHAALPACSPGNGILAKRSTSTSSRSAVALETLWRGRAWCPAALYVNATRRF